MILKIKRKNSTKNCSNKFVLFWMIKSVLNIIISQLLHRVITQRVISHRVITPKKKKKKKKKKLNKCLFYFG